MAKRKADSSGRVTLGRRYANKRVIVEERADGAVEITPAEAVPAREAWLYRNPKAADAVRAGIEDAKAGRLILVLCTVTRHGTK